MKRLRGPRTVSLSWKLTGFFVVFGLLIGYLSVLAFGAHSSRVLLKVAAAMADGAFESAFRGRDAAALSGLEGKPNDALSDFAEKFPFVADRGIAADLIVYGAPPGGGWRSFRPGAGGFLISSEVTDREASSLEQAGRGVVALRRGGRGGSLPAFLGLRPAADGTRWAIGVSIDKTGFVEFLMDNRNETAAFLVGLLLFSLVLGRLFATRFIRPLEALARTASDYAAGRGAASFSSRRRDEIGILSRTLERMREEIDKRREETEGRLQAMVAMNRIDKAVLTTTSRSELLDRVAEIVNGVFSARAVAIALRDESRGGWTVAALTGGGPAPTARPFIPDARIDPEALSAMTGYYEVPVADSRTGFAVVAREVLNAEGGRIAWCPLFVDGAFLGALVMFADRSEALTADERRTIGMLADQAAVALRSILANEEREDNFLGILRSLSRAIDAKSRWTAGHSERVADIAVRIGEALRLPQADLESLRIAAILHDVGKLGVGEAILDKPGKLNPEEYARIKLHPELGAGILSGIRSFEAIVPAILHHHERWDGKGYPRGLAGTLIPVSARIIAVADVWDAITDDRPYRAGFPEGEARKFMADNAEVMFDPEVVEAFFTLTS